jgi:hypothetical protein
MYWVGAIFGLNRMESGWADLGFYIYIYIGSFGLSGLQIGSKNIVPTRGLLRVAASYYQGPLFFRPELFSKPWNF